MSNEKRKIMVVDDEPQILCAVEDLLEDHYQVLTNLDAKSALMVLRNEKDVAVILCDQRMPGMTGDQFLKELSEFSQATRILFTGYADMEAIVRAVNRGNIYGYLAKPWEPEQLKLMVNKAVTHYELTQAVSHERDLLHSLMDNSPDHIYFKDLDLKYTRINHAQARALGLEDPAKALGRSVEAFISGDMAKQITSSEMKVVRSGEPAVSAVEKISVRGREAAWVSTTRVPIKDANGRVSGLIGISRDMTEQKLAEEEVRRLNEELEERVAERTAQLEASNKELEAFSYSVSHDLRAPLRHMNGFVRTLQKKYASSLNAEGKRFVEIIANSAARMDNLINDLLTFSRMGRTEMRKSPVSLEQLVAEVRSELQPDYQDREIEWVIPALPAVSADRAMLRQVLVNLLSNAVKFTKTREKARIELGILSPGEHSPAGTRETVFFVRDNGVGFDMTYIDKLFGVFQRLHRREEFEGTGIGLANVRRIVHRHGGRAWAESDLGSGACFYVALPNEQGSTGKGEGQ